MHHLTRGIPSSFRQPHSVHSPPRPPHPAHITSSQSPPSLPPSITLSAFHSRLKLISSINANFFRSHSDFFLTAFADAGN